MLKNLTLLILLLSACFLNAQEKLVVPEGTVFHDLPGDHFMTSQIRNGKAYLTERDAGGISVWTDSLDFEVPLNTASHFNLVRFGNTDTYAAILQKVPLEPGDANIYQFSRFDLPAHTISGHRVDTIPGYDPVIPLPVADTSMYLFFPWGEAGFEARKLNSSMSLDLVAPQESISNFTSSLTARFRFVDNKIWKSLGFGLFLRSSSYTTAVSSISVHQMEIPSIYPSPACFFRDFVNDDSILVVNSSVGEWRFTLLKKDLTVIDSVHHYLPNVELFLAIYRIKNVVVNDGKIYILGYNTVFYDQSMIFVYDFNFDLVCKVPVSSFYDERQLLEVVNGKVYFKDRPLDFMVTLYEVDNCMFTSGLGEMALPVNVAVYPNPSQGIVHVKTGESLAGKRFVVLDQLGNELLRSVVGSTDVQIDLGGFAAGVYFLRVEGENAVKVVKH